MLEILGILFCLLLLVFFMGALIAMAVLPTVQKSLDEVGPWVVVKDDKEGLFLPGVGMWAWAWTTMRDQVREFDTRAEATQWAVVSGGEVRAAREVVW